MNDTFNGLYNIRDFEPSDTNLILATFLRGLYYGDSWFSLIPKPIFIQHYKPVIEVMIAKRTIKIACLPDDPTVILGYSIMSNDFQTIDWVFVKSAWRKKGIGKSLLPQFPTAVTHLTKIGLTLMSKFPNCIFNPFALG